MGNKFSSYYQNDINKINKVNYENIKNFLDTLEAEGKKDWQIRQAYQAIKLFLENFMNLVIDFNKDSKQKDLGKENRGIRII